jgi:hypothetical protein
MRSEIIKTRNINNPRTGLKALRYNPTAPLIIVVAPLGHRGSDRWRIRTHIGFAIGSSLPTIGDLYKGACPSASMQQRS